MHHPRRVLGACEIIPMPRVEMALQPSGFRRGAERCMGAPRGNGFLFAPLGAG